ncbi:MAG: archaellin/type IV pilin N-terminal domain-containing protein [Nanoarchaeota archaeon]
MNTLKGTSNLKKVTSKRGLSAVIGTLIMVTITIVAGVIIWGVTNAFIDDNIESAQKCSNLYEKIEFNTRFTCYNSTSGELQFAITLRDVDIDGAVVIVSSISGSESYELSNELESVSGLLSFSRTPSVKLPGKNGAQTYIATGFSSIPDKIEIAAIIKEEQCDISDSLSNFDDCQLFIS